MASITEIFPREVTKSSTVYIILEPEPECLSRNKEHPSFDVTCCKKSIVEQTKLNHSGRNRHVNNNIAESKQKRFQHTQGLRVTTLSSVGTTTEATTTASRKPINFKNGCNCVSNFYTQNGKKCVAVENHMNLQLTDDCPKAHPMTVMCNKCGCSERRLFEKCIGSNAPTWQRGPYSKRFFSLGTAEDRRLQRNSCSTRMIGGYRVPVCKIVRF